MNINTVSLPACLPCLVFLACKPGQVCAVVFSPLVPQMGSLFLATRNILRLRTSPPSLQTEQNAAPFVEVYRTSTLCLKHTKHEFMTGFIVSTYTQTRNSTTRTETNGASIVEFCPTKTCLACCWLAKVVLSVAPSTHFKIVTK